VRTPIRHYRHCPKCGKKVRVRLGSWYAMHTIRRAHRGQHSALPYCPMSGERIVRATAGEEA
jgi:hypothetical protein